MRSHRGRSHIAQQASTALARRRLCSRAHAAVAQRSRLRLQHAVLIARSACSLCTHIVRTSRLLSTPLHTNFPDTAACVRSAACRLCLLNKQSGTDAPKRLHSCRHMTDASASSSSCNSSGARTSHDSAAGSACQSWHAFQLMLQLSWKHICLYTHSQQQKQQTKTGTHLLKFAKLRQAICKHLPRDGVCCVTNNVHSAPVTVEVNIENAGRGWRAHVPLQDRQRVGTRFQLRRRAQVLKHAANFARALLARSAPAASGCRALSPMPSQLLASPCKPLRALNAQQATSRHSPRRGRSCAGCHLLHSGLAR